MWNQYLVIYNHTNSSQVKSRNMLSSASDEAENEIFFDSLDRFSSRDDLSMSFSNTRKLGYEIWVHEPSSIVERRQNFLQQMGLAEFASSTAFSFHEEVNMGFNGLVLDRDSNGAVSTHSHVSSDDTNIHETFEYSYSHQRENSGEAEANLMSDQLQGLQKQEQSIALSAAQETLASSPSAQHFSHSYREECRNLRKGAKKMSSWWKHFVNKRKDRSSRVASEESKPVVETPKGANKIKVLHEKKRCLELTAPYVAQEIRAHEGFIWTIKFSPDRQFLASGGEDGVVRVWRVGTVDSSSDYLTAEENFCTKLNERKFSFQQKNSIHPSVIFPDKIFHIEESPIQEFHGHSSDILDLAWSNSNCILSSSKDKTVRLWQLGCNDSLNVFHHNNYVTCIHFNPVDDNYFISGSIDGKVRIWGLSEKRVVDWTDVRDVITAICYQPDGQGFIVGSITGTCCSYKASDEGLVLDARIHIPGRKKSARNKITGIKFSQEKSKRVMISSEDSKLHIFDGVDLHLAYKYKGLPKSGSQMSASFTSSERHIISLGEDSRVYIWNHNTSSVPSSKQKNSVKTCEHFFYEGISVAIAWSGMITERGSSVRAQEQLEGAFCIRESERFSLGSWFSTDGVCRGSATWPEEKLPLWEVSSTTEDQNHKTAAAISETWGLVIIAAGLDGTIKTFHNYGLPVRL